MRPVIVIIFILTAFIAVAKSNVQLFQISRDMALESGYKKRGLVKPKDSFFPSLVRYSSESAEFLSSIEDKNLLGFHCSDRMLRTSQGVYLLETVKTTTRDKRRIKNQAFIEFMRNKEKNLPKGKKILTARICETEDKTILVFYSIGRYDITSADNSPITQTIFNSTDNEAFLEIIPRNFILSNKYNLAKSPAHLRCDEPFQIGVNHSLSVLCDEQQANLANYTIYGVDLKTGITRLLRRCENNFTDRLKTVCS